MNYHVNEAIFFFLEHYHWKRVFPIQHSLDVGNDLPDVVVRELGAPSCSDSFRSIYQHHRNDGTVPLRLNLQVVIKIALQQRIIVYVE